jgi:hypothetical protein
MLPTTLMADDERLCELLLYFGGPVDYDRYVDPEAAEELTELGLIRRDPDGCVQLTRLGMTAYRAMAGGAVAGATR